MSKCRYKAKDGECLYEKRFPYKEYCVEGPCPHDVEENDFWKNEYIKEHDARVEEYKNSVPVVRCAFCKHYIKHDKRCTIWNHGVFKDDYCSRGQKMEEVEE